MPNQFIGEFIVCSLISLIIGGLGFLQYKSDIPLNIGFHPKDVKPRVLAKVLGLHVMGFALFTLLVPFISLYLQQSEHANLIELAGSFILILLFILSINYQLKSNKYK